MMARLRRLRLRGEEGLSLVEMVVVTAVLAVVLAMVQSTTITLQKDVSSNSARLDQLQQSKLAIESMSKILRTSVLPSLLNCSGASCDTSAFVAGDVRSVQFYANINNDSNVTGPSKVSYVVSANGKLTESIHGPNPHAATDYNYQYTCTPPTAGCVVRSRVLASNVDVTQPMFTYYDNSGAVLSPPLNSTTLTAVDSIDILIKVKVSKFVKAITVTERVTLPNADSVPDATST